MSPRQGKSLLKVLKVGISLTWEEEKLLGLLEAQVERSLDSQQFAVKCS